MCPTKVSVCESKALVGGGAAAATVATAGAAAAKGRAAVAFTAGTYPRPFLSSTSAVYITKKTTKHTLQKCSHQAEK
jgi:hypothetical protein